MFSWSAHGIRDALLYQAIRFFRLRGTREKAARGFAIGLACNFHPTFGLGSTLELSSHACAAEAWSPDWWAGALSPLSGRSSST